MSDWEGVRTRVETITGENLWDTTEQPIRWMWERHPTYVEEELERCLLDRMNGTITHVWPVLRSRLQQNPPAGRLKLAPADRPTLIERASRWIREVGWHYPTAEALLDELFGNRYGRPGLLHEWESDAWLRGMMVTLWEVVREQAA